MGLRSRNSGTARRSLGSQSVSACLGLRTEGSGYSVTELLFEGMAVCRAVAMIVTTREWFQCSRILCRIPRHVIPRALRFKFSLSVCDMRRKWHILRINLGKLRRACSKSDLPALRAGSRAYNKKIYLSIAVPVQINQEKSYLSEN